MLVAGILFLVTAVLTALAPVGHALHLLSFL